MAELVEGGLTGARRFRCQTIHSGKTEFGTHRARPELVLQVQYNTWVQGSETKPEAHWATLWRDATPADITPAEDIV